MSFPSNISIQAFADDIFVLVHSASELKLKEDLSEVVKQILHWGQKSYMKFNAMYSSNELFEKENQDHEGSRR